MFLKDETYMFPNGNEYPIFSVADENSNESNLNFEISQKHIRIEDIKNKFPDEYLIKDITGVCGMGVYSYNGYITGYGNENCALLLKHYKARWDNNSFVIYSKDMFVPLPEVNSVEFNISSFPSITEKDIDMLLKLGSMLQKYIGEPLVVSIDKEKAIKIDEFADYLYQKINKT